MGYKGSSLNLKAWVCPVCRRPLPIDRFRLRRKLRPDRDNAIYTYYELYACKQCRHTGEVRKPQTIEQKQRRKWKNARKKQAKLNGKRAFRHKKRSFMSQVSYHVGQLSFLGKAECLPCTKCGSLGPKYKNDSWCKECTKEDIKERRRRRKIENPEAHAAGLARLRKWKEDHPGCNKRKYLKGSYFPPKHWDAVLDAFSHQCAYCGAEHDLQRDHVVPYRDGGRMRLGNVVPACGDCNVDKSSRNLRDWLNDECLYEAIMMSMGDAECLSQY